MAKLDGGLERIDEVAVAESDGLEDGTADVRFQKFKVFRDDGDYDARLTDTVFYILLV